MKDFFEWVKRGNKWAHDLIIVGGFFAGIGWFFLFFSALLSTWSWPGFFLVLATLLALWGAPYLEYLKDKGSDQ